MKQFKSKTCLRIPPTKYKLNSQQRLQKTQASKEKDENLEFSFDNQNLQRPLFSRSLSNGQKPIQVQIVILKNQRKNKEQIQQFSIGVQILRENYQTLKYQEEPEPQEVNQKDEQQIEQDYQNHIKPIEDSYKEEFLSQLIEDSIQLEALFYQMAQNNLLIAPITSSPPLIAYYIFCLIVGYKYPDPEILTRHLNYAFTDFSKLQDMIELGALQLPLKLLLISLAGKIFWNFDRLFIIHTWEILKLLNQYDSFNIRLAIDDFVKYSDLYHQNKVEIDKNLQYQFYKKQNLCVGFIRFIFIYPSTGLILNIRIPIGEFQVEKAFTFQDITGENSFLNESWYKDFDNEHCEKIILAWIVINQNILIEQIYEQITKNSTDYLNLEKVYLEVTSERRVNDEGVTIFSLFPLIYISDMIVNKLNQKNQQTFIAVTAQFQLIVVTQYFYQGKEIDHDDLSSRSKYKLNLKKRIALPYQGDHKNFIYFDLGHVGMMTSNYLIRYTNNIRNTQINQQIDQIKLINTIFMSNESSQTMFLYKLKQSYRLQDMISISQQFKENIQKISYAKKIIKQQENTSIEQNQIQQIFSLIWLIIRECEVIPIEVDLFHLKLLMTQCLKFPDQIVFSNMHFIFLIKQSQLFWMNFNKQSKEIFKKLYITNLFYCQHNIELFLKDCSYLDECIRKRPELDTSELDEGQLKANYKIQYKNILGIIQAFVSIKKSEEIEERVQIQLNLDQFNQEQILNQLNELQKSGHIINKIQLLICTIQQLSLNQKEYLNSIIQLQDFNVHREYYYIYFRNLQTNQEHLENERQYTIYDLNVFQARYQLSGTQISFYDMDELINKQKIIIRSDEEIRELQQK